MRRISLFLPLLLLPGCLVGKIGEFDLKKDLSPEQIARLQDRDLSSTEKGDMYYSIPILPIFAGFTAIATKNPQNPSGYFAIDVDSILLSLPYASLEKANWDAQGKHLAYQNDWSLLLGLLYRDWSGWTAGAEGEAPKTYGGFSIAWGLFKVEKEQSKTKIGAFWGLF